MVPDDLIKILRRSRPTGRFESFVTGAEYRKAVGWGAAFVMMAGSPTE